MHPFLEKNYKSYLKDKYFVLSSLFAVLFFILSLFINYYSGVYANRVQSNPVTDVILSNTPVFDVDFIFVYGIVAFCIFVLILCLARWRVIPFVAKALALFVIVRSIFITLTHLGLFPDAIPMDSNILSKFTFGGDLFFSGHTGLPFLMALIFWDNKVLRYVFLVMSFLFGATVLLGHYHYTIDVLASFFITYGVYDIAVYFFKKDHKIFVNGV